MTLKAHLKLYFALILSGWVVHEVYLADQQSGQKEKVQSSLGIARQIYSEIESLRLYGKEQGMTEPTAWAIRILTNGLEDRPIRILTFSHPMTEEEERFELSADSTSFSYSRLLSTETLEGIQVLIHQNFEGFLGSRNRWVNDLLLSSFFFLNCSLLLSLLQFRRREEPETVESTAPVTDAAESEDGERPDFLNLNSEPKITNILNFPAESSGKKAQTESLPQTPTAENLAPPLSTQPLTHLSPQWLSDWVNEARKSLLTLGLNIKKMTQEARNLTQTATVEIGLAEAQDEELPEVTHRLSESISDTTESMMNLARDIQKLKNYSSDPSQKETA